MPEKYLVRYIHYATSGAEAELDEVWRRIEDEKLADDLFYDGSITNSHEFMAMALRPGCLPFLAYCEGEPAMFTWLNCLEGRMARAHFVVFREFRGRKKRVPLGRRLYGHILHCRDKRGHILDCLYGITPVSHRLALNAVIACGWEERGILPHACYLKKSGETVDGVITCATREILGHANS